jgi:phage shock protein PspC (stress-responsive transcriptional regulator)
MASTGIWLYVIAAIIMPGSDDIVINDAKPLRRARGTGIFGVCAGIAKYIGADVTVVRLVMVLFAIFGIGVLFYIVSAIVIPSEKNA